MKTSRHNFRKRATVRLKTGRRRLATTAEVKAEADAARAERRVMMLHGDIRDLTRRLHAALNRDLLGALPEKVRDRMIDDMTHVVANEFGKQVSDALRKHVSPRYSGLITKVRSVPRYDDHIPLTPRVVLSVHLPGFNFEVMHDL